MNIAKPVRSIKQFRLPVIAILSLTLIGGLYSVINMQIAFTGQRILDLDERLQRLNRVNKQLELEISRESAFDRIEPRARALGLRPTTTTQTTYLVVKNYPVTINPSVTAQTTASPRATGFIAIVDDLLSRLGLAPGTATAEAGAIR
ncbi:MAG: hypothetical protein HY070_08865 [Chloroflexi bacterium]|nr:hypothetical protein [Chloroflexota bacterium]